MSENLEMNKTVLTKSELNRSWLTWLFNNQACYNYERMMGIGYLHSLVPIFKKLYKDDVEKQREALRRHTGFFNCEPCFGSTIVGLTVAMEEKKSLGADIDGDGITSVKSGLMGPLSGIGDTVIQGVIVPLLLAFAIDLAASGNLFAPVLYSIVMVCVVFGISYYGYMLGYKRGSDAILSMLENGLINKLIAGANIVGCMVLGALVANYVSMYCGINIVQSAESVFSIQEQLFDAILPKMLPLALTLGCYKLLQSGKSSVFVMLVIIATGIVGGLTGILGTGW